jgi:hypothetical protein
MKIKAYIFFPESDLAFQNLADSPESYRDIVKELSEIKCKLKQKFEFEICYDSNNVSNFLTAAKGYIQDRYLAGIENQIRIIIGNTSKNVLEPRFRVPHYIYANWSIDLSVIFSPNIISESAEDSLRDSDTERTICICLGNSINTQREELHIIKDAIHDDTLPKLINVNATNSEIAFVKWITTLPLGQFSLKKNNEFQPLDKFWGRTQERIYRHKKTGNHWYFDYNHKYNKIHYEVFDSSGNIHLGEADENGIIKPETQSNTKKISHIL